MAGAGTVGLVVAMLCVGASTCRSTSVLEENADQEMLEQGETWVFRPGDVGGPHSIRWLREQGMWAVNIAPGETEEARGALNLDSRSTTGENGRTWAIVAGVLVAVAGVAVLMMVFPVVVVCIVRTLGFTAQGIAAGSKAAFIMSLYAGRVALWSFCAICQRIGAVGVAGVTAIFACGTYIVIAVVLSLLTIGLVSYYHQPLNHFFHHLGSFCKELGNTILEALRSL